MPPVGSKGQSKGKEGRQSRSRNTTPGSAVSAPTSAMSPRTAFLDIPVGSLMIPANVLYDDILERHGGSGGIPDPKHLEALANDLRALSSLAESRSFACDGGMRKLADRRKERIEEQRELEQANRDAEEKASLKRAAEDDEVEKSGKAGKLKKRKDRGSIREERPLAHGAHGVARQDGTGLDVRLSSPRPAPSSTKATSPSKRKRTTSSGSSSSLSLASQLQSPTIATHPQAKTATRISPSPSSSSDDSHQPPPAPSIPQYQTFGTDPLSFDDPTIYHIREVTADMTDEEKKEIYGVRSFPHDDLSDLIAGVPPDKDFSNAKPSNQVNANTFQTYLEPYLRPLTEEDLGFLKERGDRVNPFLIPPLGKKHYTEVWAEEDGVMPVDPSLHGKERLPANQARGNVEQIDDDNLETDQVSTGPLLSRLLSTMRYEHRAPPTEDKDRTNGLTNGIGESSLFGTSMGDPNDDPFLDFGTDSRLPPATSFPESSQPNWKVPSTKLDYPQMEERLKAELRYMGFLGEGEEPEYDEHWDDEVCQRLRFLQAKLKEQCFINGARKSRMLQVAQERMAYQEYSTILEDLNTQVEQAYLKRNRTLGKGKKNAKRPGGAGGGSHVVGTAQGTARPAVSDQVKVLLERRKKWMDTITPVFSDDVLRVRGEGEDIFDPEIMLKLEASEREKWDEEVE